MQYCKFLVSLLLTVVLTVAHAAPRDVSTTFNLPPDLIGIMSPDMIFNYFFLTLNGQSVNAADFVTAIHITDIHKNYAVVIKHKILNLYDIDAKHPDVTVSMDQSAAEALLLGQVKPVTAINNGLVKVAGNPSEVNQFMGMIKSHKNT